VVAASSKNRGLRSAELGEMDAGYNALAPITDH